MLAWMAVQSHLSAIFVAAPLLVALVAADLQVRRAEAARNIALIAGVIFAEHAEHGYLGAPIAKYAMETYFAKKEGRPLPTLAKPSAPAIVTADDPTITPTAAPTTAPARRMDQRP